MRILLIPLLGCMGLSTGCGATRAQIDTVAALPIGDGETATFKKMSWIAAIRLAKDDMADKNFVVQSEQDIPYGRMAIFSSRYLVVRVVSVGSGEGAKVTVKCESFGDSTQRATAKAYFEAHPNAGVLIALGQRENERELEHEKVVERQTKLDDDRAAEIRLRDDNQRAIDAWNSLPPAERIAGRQWQDTFNRYIRLDYKYDEAELMADRIAGGRPAHLPPRE